MLDVFKSGSLADSEDLIEHVDTKRMKLVRKISDENIGKILLFCTSADIFKIFINLCKSLCNYLTIQKPELCCNIYFGLDRNIELKNSIHYVYKLKLHFIDGFDETNLKYFPKLNHLDVDWNLSVVYFTDLVFKNITRVKHLSLERCAAVQGKGLKYVKKLTYLKIHYNSKILDEHFKPLKNLKGLYISNCPKLNGKCIDYLKDTLLDLHVAFQRVDFSTEYIKGCKKLHSFALEYTKCTVDEDFFLSIKQISKLRLWANKNILNLTDIEQLRLNELHIGNQKSVRDKLYMPHGDILTSLTIWNCRKITGKNFQCLKVLKVLKILDNPGKFVDNIFKKLPKTVEVLCLFKCPKIRGSLFESLPNLKRLWLRENHNISLDDILTLKKLHQLVSHACTKILKKNIYICVVEKKFPKDFEWRCVNVEKKKKVSFGSALKNLPTFEDLVNPNAKKMEEKLKQKQIIDDFKNF